MATFFFMIFPVSGTKLISFWTSRHHHDYHSPFALGWFTAWFAPCCALDQILRVSWDSSACPRLVLTSVPPSTAPSTTWRRSWCEAPGHSDSHGQSVADLCVKTIQPGLSLTSIWSKNPAWDIHGGFLCPIGIIWLDSHGKVIRIGKMVNNFDCIFIQIFGDNPPLCNRLFLLVGVGQHHLFQKKLGLRIRDKHPNSLKNSVTFGIMAIRNWLTQRAACTLVKFQTFSVNLKKLGRFWFFVKYI